MRTQVCWEGRILPFLPDISFIPWGFTGPFTFVHLMERFLFPAAYVQGSEGQFMRLTLTDSTVLKSRIYSATEIIPMSKLSVVFIGRCFLRVCNVRFDLPEFSVCTLKNEWLYCVTVKQRLRSCYPQKIWKEFVQYLGFTPAVDFREKWRIKRFHKQM